MLRKSQEESIPSVSRTKLPQESAIRSLAGIKELQAMAESPRGSQIELSWTTKVPGQVFVLAVQWDPNMDDPFWTLYEANAGLSKQVWNQSFAAADIELLYDVLIMTCGGVDKTKNLSDILKLQPNSAKEEHNKSSPSKPSTSSSLPSLNSNSAASSTPTSGPAFNPNSSPVPGAAPAPAPANDPNAGAIPGYAFPGVVGMPINPGMPSPLPMYNMPPNMAAMPVPYPANIDPATNSWVYAPAPGVTPNVFMAPVAGAASHAGGFSALPIDSSLVNKQVDISLLDLLVKAELLTEPVLAAALKIQDFVRAEKLNLEKAVEILKHHHHKGVTIEDYIYSSGISSPSNRTPSKPVVAKKPEEKEVLAALKLFEQAGLLSADDIKTAEDVSHKHGGDVVSILMAAQKLDDKTLEAARICNTLEKEGSLKLEQCVMIINYCSRSRVDFDEAIVELNWENPRKLKK